MRMIQPQRPSSGPKIMVHLTIMIRVMGLIIIIPQRTNTMISKAPTTNMIQVITAVIRPAVIITTGEIMLMTLAGRMVGMRMRITMMIFGMIHIW